MALIYQQLDEHGILTLTLNRPEKLNALSLELLGELEALLDKAAIDASVKAILLTGAGKAFCAGADISRLAECNAEGGYQFAVSGQKIFRKLETLGKPSLAAINGYAFGGGCELAMAATMRIAANTAQFGQPEIKLGVIPGYGGTQRLARLVGKGRALDLCLTGRFIDAETALNWGLVSEVVSADALMIKAHEILSSWVKLAPLALKSILEVMDRGYNLSLEDALHLEAVHFAKICATSDKKEGVQAFLEKRAAHFEGV